MSDRALRVGDVIAHTQGTHRRFYFVVGFSPRGKTRLRRGWTNTELLVWWVTERGLPENYSLEEAA